MERLGVNIMWSNAERPRQHAFVAVQAGTKVQES